MSTDELRKWATMGLSQNDEIDPKDKPSEGYSDKGFISRFGVGAKRAAFFLGQEVTVTTKVASSKWVAQTSLSPVCYIHSIFTLCISTSIFTLCISTDTQCAAIFGSIRELED